MNKNYYYHNHIKSIVTEHLTMHTSMRIDKQQRVINSIIKIYDKLNRYSFHRLPDGSKQLPSYWLTENCGFNYKEIVSLAIELGIIECTNSKYEVGNNKFKEYRICPSFLLSCQKDISVLTTDIEKDLQNSLTSEFLADNPHVLSNLNKFKIQVNDEDLKIFVNRSKSIIDKDQQLSTMQHNIKRINEKDAEIIITENGKRLFNSFTNLLSILRCYIVNVETGELLEAEVDICNTQPLLTCIYMLNKQSSLKYNESFMKYFELCQTGQIYDYIADKTILSRNIVKSFFMEVFLFTQKQIVLNGKETGGKFKPYTPEHKASLNVIRDFMLKEFEVVWETNLEMKKSLGKDGNKLYACEIQEMESNLMIKSLMPLTKECQPHFTVHDSVCGSLNDILYFADMINKLFMDLYNCKVTLKTTILEDKLNKYKGETI